MNPFGLGAVVRLVNRVVDADGNRVPQEFMVGGVAFWLKDTLDVPIEVARIVIQQSMYKIDPVTYGASYKVGCEALGIPIDSIPLEETQRLELIEREYLTPDRQFGAKDRHGRTLKPVRMHNPIRRKDPLSVGAPHPSDNGALPGEYGSRR
jgi:hypothetical protein